MKKPRPARAINLTAAGIKPVRWRRLQNNRNPNRIVIIYGYSAFPDQMDALGNIYTPAGPWFGYTRKILEKTPCAHCEATGIFHQESWKHQCPGQRGGVILPCLLAHDCEGKPAILEAQRWAYDEWHEIRFDEELEVE